MSDTKPKRPRQRSLRLTVPRPEPEREEPIQRRIVDLLSAAGYRVLVTSVRYKLQTCPECNHRHRAAGGYGATPGVPDLLVSCDRWPTAYPAWIGVECKGEKTPLSLEQRELHGLGRIVVARSERQALEMVQATERLLFGKVYGGRVEAFGKSLRIGFRPEREPDREAGTERERD